MAKIKPLNPSLIDEKDRKNQLKRALEEKAKLSKITKKLENEKDRNQK